MADNSKKVSELPNAANAAGTDKILILRSPGASPSLRTMNVETFCANIVVSNSAPANSSANGLIGFIRYDSSYVYICVANNTWKRAALSTW